MKESKYLKGIFVGIVVIAVALMAIFAALVIYLNRPSNQDNASLDDIKESTEYISQYEVPTNEVTEIVPETETPLTSNIEDADNDTIPAYADEELSVRNIDKDEYLQLTTDEYKTLLASIDTVEECDLFLEKYGSSVDVLALRERLIREEGSATEDEDAQKCIEKLNNIFDDIAELNASNYQVLNGTADTDAFQNSFVSFLLKYDLYTEEFMADYAYYLSNLSINERLMEHVFTRCSYPYTPFFTEKFQLVQNIYCNGSSVMYVNDEKIIKVTIYTPDGDSYAYFKNYDGDWKIYFTEFTPVYGNGITAETYKNKTP